MMHQFALNIRTIGLISKKLEVFKMKYWEIQVRFEFI